MRSKEGSGRDEAEMRDEYDFSGGVRGKFYKDYTQGTNVVLLDADVAEIFHDSEAVNPEGGTHGNNR